MGEALISAIFQIAQAKVQNILSRLTKPGLLMLFSSVANASKSFDEKPYTLSASLEASPMYTLVGITDWGKEILRVYGITTVVLVFVFLCVAIPIIVALWKFKAKGDEVELPKQTTGNHFLELMWTIVPVGLLLIIAIPTWEAIFRQADGPQEGALKITAIGHQWWWEFQYPDLGITTANELHLPENTPVSFTITSDDVIHSFYIPRFGGKLDALPGVKNYLHYTTPALQNPQNVGGEFYQGHCMELCGYSHALMRFEAFVHSQKEFDSWAKNAMNPPQVLSAQEKRGSEVFNQCQSCHTIAGTDSAKISGKKLGPDLTNFGNRRTLGAVTRANSIANIRQWIKDPTSIKPGSKMPAFNEILTDQQIDDVASYIRISTAKKF